MQSVLEKCFAEGISHLTFTGMSVLPAIEPDFFNDGVDIYHYALDDNRRVSVLDFLEKFGECRFAAFLLLGGRNFLFGCNHIFR